MNKIKEILLNFLDTVTLAGSKVVSNERLSPHFQFITIKGKSLKKTNWLPGQKIQVQLKGDEKRSYTPSSWNKEDGSFQTLVYMHGKGPGALWARDVKTNTKVTVIGPKASLVIAPEIEHVLFFGDETTFGLAHALKTYNKEVQYNFFFEASDINESLHVLKKLNLEDSKLFGIGELEKISSEIKSIFNSNKKTQITLSGKQQSIVALRELLYAIDFPKEIIGTKVYWGWKDDPNGKLKNN
jgi:ferric-chelate reductase (NADPH)